MKLEWSPDTQFNVPGFVVETLMHEINEKINTPEAQKTIRLYECYKELQSIVGNGVTEGKVRQIE